MLRTSAQVPELVDGLDLGSSVLVAWGFDSPPGHHNTFVWFQQTT